jgi:hypothetical protein
MGQILIICRFGLYEKISIHRFIGWVNKIQVAKTIFLNPKTFVECDK